MSDEQKQEEATQPQGAVEAKTSEEQKVPLEAMELCSDPEKIIAEINELNNQYKMLIAQKYHVIGQLQKIEEGIQKCMGAYQALKKLYVSAVKAKEEKPNV